MTLEANLAAADFPKPTIANIVATVNLGCKLDLKKIAMKTRNAEYNPKRFPAIIIRIREPKTTCLLFSSGKMVVTGAKSISDSKIAARKYSRIVQKVGLDIGIQVKFSDFKIHNIVASCNVNFPIRLETLSCTGTHGCANYEAELFPGLIYNVLKPKVVFLIFASGKVVITGAKSFENDTLKAWELMYPVIAEHRRNNPRNVVTSHVQDKSATKRGRKQTSGSKPVGCF